MDEEIKKEKVGNKIRKRNALIFITSFIIVTMLIVSIVFNNKGNSNLSGDLDKYVDYGESKIETSEVSKEDADEANKYIDSVQSNLDDKKTSASTDLELDNSTPQESIIHDATIDSKNVYDDFKSINFDSMEYGDVAYYYTKNDDKTRSINFARKYPEMTPEKVVSLENKITEHNLFGFKKVTSITINDTFDVVAEERYVFNATTKKVTKDDDGADITNDVGFDTSKCNTSLDFLKKCLIRDGIDDEFMTDDMSHYKQRVDEYSFDLSKCSIKDTMMKDSGISDVSKFDCTYNISNYTDYADAQIHAICATLSGTTSDKKEVTMYITYLLWYE